MGQAREPWPVKLVVPMFSGDGGLLDEASSVVADRFGPADYGSERMPFAHTDYYTPEFGPGLMRQLLSFERLIDPGSLAEIKLWTNSLEQAWLEGGRRRINLDPGYLSSAKLVLATTKNHCHRIYLREGIYAEVTLMYRDGDYRTFPWTYPDYASEPYLDIMRAIRTLYVDQIRALRKARSLTPR